MTNEATEELDVVWEMRDPARPDDELILEFYVRCAPKPDGAGPARIVQELAGPIDESPEVEDRWFEELYSGFTLALEAWCEANGVVLTEDPSAIAAQMMVAASATEAQRENYEYFRNAELADDAIEACLAVAEAANLPFEDLGDVWGVTLAPAASALLRLNVGVRALLDVKSDGHADIAVLGTQEDFDSLPAGVSVLPGFPAVADSLTLRVGLGDDLEALLGIQGIPERIEAHARTSWRALLNTNWHNPLSELFLVADESDRARLTGSPPADSDGEPVARGAEHGGRYRPIWEWLTSHERVEFRTSFGEVERVAGRPLPNSCRDHISHWHSYQGSAVARAILDAGWHANHVDLNAQEVTFTPGPPPRARTPSG